MRGHGEIHPGFTQRHGIRQTELFGSVRVEYYKDRAYEIENGEIRADAMKRRAEIAGLLAALFLAAIAWAEPRRSGAELNSSNLPSSRNDKSSSQSNFAGKLPIRELNEEEAILHALNRLGFGPRPGQVEQIEKTGLENWIQAQLHPESIPDPIVDARLSQYHSLGLSAAGLLDQYPPQDIAAKRLGMKVEDYQKRLQDLAKQPGGMNSLPFKDPNESVNDVMQAKMIRAVYSERQLAEQLADFWFNHFNIFIYKDVDRWYMIPYERDAIRPHALGKFRDLLEATAKSPAMLFYLDNSSSADPNAFDRLKLHPVPPRPGVKLPPLGPKRGLNENYGRELMELHTLGVDGGYKQNDVIEVARAFTGWTIESPRENPVFYFDERIHDPNPKRVLGKTIKGGGIKEGEQVLDLLVKNPHTARHISLQLAEHFVSDDPPPAVVARMAKAFEKSNGDIRTVMTTMIYSPEFWSRSAFRAKVKTPFELVASTSRALGADVDQPLQLAQWVARIGEPLYQCLTPNGYSDKAASWISTGSLLNRMNFAVALTGNKVRGAQVDITSLVGADAGTNPHLALERVETEFLAGQVTDSTRATLEKEMTEPQILGAKLDDPVTQINIGLITGLVLGSPEFQKR
ncbi:MAG TPA: DUF1800 domain-containing protein [Candidatus Acidoferrales bacterium]|nr:DUF1800 domain-containing protein [Candidatus Acidoferrales bacterium]